MSIQVEDRPSLDEWEWSVQKRVFAVFCAFTLLLRVVSGVLRNREEFAWKENVKDFLELHWEKFGVELRHIEATNLQLRDVYILSQAILPCLSVLLTFYYVASAGKKSDTNLRTKFYLRRDSFLITLASLAFVVWIVFFHDFSLGKTHISAFLFETPMLLIWISVIYSGLTISLIRVLITVRLDYLKLS